MRSFGFGLDITSGGLSVPEDKGTYITLDPLTVAPGEETGVLPLVPEALALGPGQLTPPSWTRPVRKQLLKKLPQGNKCPYAGGVARS